MAKQKLSDLKFDKWSNGLIKINEENSQKMKDLLDSTGPGFCLAKWTQVTMHLGVGLTHSCHHPGAHKIPLEELEKNPSALHNTEFKKQRRKEMLAGERPAECDFCWRIEDNTQEFSDRVYKSLDAFSINEHDLITEMTGSEDIFPKYVEVSFNNVCNFKCSYCGPTFSSKWVEEIKQHGSYKFLNNDAFNEVTDVQIKEREDNPYTTAFWKWFPEAVTHMHTFRITGGEPLLSKHTMRVVDYLIENPQPELEFAINSNGNPPQAIWDEFVKKVSDLVNSGCIKKFTLFTSAESVGPAAEYSRFGMEWDRFEKNIVALMDSSKKINVTIMAAFNILSLTTFTDLLKWTLELKRKYNRSPFFAWIEESDVSCEPIVHYGSDENSLINRREPSVANSVRINIDIPYVRNPKFLDCNIASMQLIEQLLLPAVDFMYKNAAHDDWDATLGFNQWEAAKLKRIFVDVLCEVKDARNSDETTTNKSISKQRSDFYEFVNEYDRRRKTNFLDTFPEMQQFYNLCELEYFKIQEQLNQ